MNIACQRSSAISKAMVLFCEKTLDFDRPIDPP